ncbi:2285_t:CDS:2 [Rhizophagus irregularis]|nr:2285_t:CDS:2 [Rhizophagus irregularis]
MPPKKKITLTDNQKYELCLYANSNKENRAHYVNWVKQKWGVERHKPVTYPELEVALKEFVLNYQHRAILSDAILIEKAKLIAEGLGISENKLQFSNGWLQGFKRRNGIRQQKLQGEAASADQTAILEALPILQPDRTLATRRISGRKKNKERLSIALCANADGSHKLPPLIIGKYANPRCFKNINIRNLSMTYRNNNKAWMLTTLFQDWLRDFDRQIEAGQYIQDLKMSVLQVIQYIIQGWNEVTTETISNCWNHTKILSNTDCLDDIKADNIGAENHIETDDTEADDLVLNEISRMLEIINLPNSMGTKEFLNIPEENIVYEVPEDITEFIEIFKKQSEENTNDLNDLDEIDDSTKIVTVGTNVALKSLNTVHTYLLQQENSNEQIKLVNTIEKFVRKKQTQTTIHQYFI